MSKRWSLVFVGCTLLVVAAAVGAPSLAGLQPSELDQAETRLRRRFNEQDAMLRQDRQAAERAITAMVAGGTARERAESLAAWSWLWLRTGKQATPISKAIAANAIQAKAETLGELQVNSNPNQATITIDNELMEGTFTNTTIWAEQGRRRVQVALNEYAPAQQNCDVGADKTVRFSATLGKGKSTADCR